MKLVIEALQRHVRLEEAAIMANKIERDSRMNLPGWKGSPMHPERHEYLAELRKAIKILESPSDSEAVGVTKDEMSFIIDAVNAYGHEAREKLEHRNSLGTIEAKNYERQLKKCIDFMNKY